MARIILSVFAFVCIFANANEPLSIIPEGLPTQLVNEIDLFQFSHETRRFVRIPAGQEKPHNLYVRWTPKWTTYRWVTGSDRRIIVDGSKLQGWRLGFTGQAGKNWYQLSNNSGDWRKVTDRERPLVYREDPVWGKMVSERCPDEWIHWGGELDPDPADPVRCTLAASPTEITVGQPTVITMTTTGPAREANIDGTPIGVPSGRITFTGREPGTKRFIGSVKSAAGQSSTCQTEVKVNAVITTPVSCDLTASPSVANVGQMITLYFRAQGELAEALLDGIAIPLTTHQRQISHDTPGIFTPKVRIKGKAGNTAECETTYEVVR